VIGAALAVAAATAAPATPPVCQAETIQQALLAAKKLTREDIKNGEVVDLIRCGDVTADGAKDALFTVASGGTAGDTRFGVLRGTQAGAPRKLVLYKQGYKVGIDRRTSRAFEILQPHYGPNDPNCCPSSFRMTRYTWTGTTFKAGKPKKLAAAPRRFYRP
jgi:hypothetical protein